MCAHIIYIYAYVHTYAFPLRCDRCTRL